MDKEGILTLCVIVIWMHLRSVDGACTVQVANLKAAGLSSPANAAAVDWDYQASGCSVSSWTVHYDAAAPVEKLKSRGQANTPSHMKSYIILEAGSFYNIYVEAGTSTGEKIKSSNIIYPPSNHRPESFPPNFNTISVGYKIVSVAWERCDPAFLNGGFKAYSITYQDKVTRKSVTVDVTDKDTLNETFSGLVPGRNYVFVIRCGNDAGFGPYSSPLTATIPSSPTTPTPTTSTLATPTEVPVVQTTPSKSFTGDVVTLSQSPEAKVTTTTSAASTIAPTIVGSLMCLLAFHVILWSEIRTIGERNKM